MAMAMAMLNENSENKIENRIALIFHMSQTQGIAQMRIMCIVYMLVFAFFNRMKCIRF